MYRFAPSEFWSIVVGASLLSLNAGFINVVTLTTLIIKATVSHVTGNVSQISIALVHHDPFSALLISLILLSFMFGSFIAGLVVGDSKFRLGRGYGLAILIESAALFACLGFLKKGWVAGDCCAAFACGLQNALATSYSGAVVRTTHMTGICTDIGNILGQACRKDSPYRADLWKLKVFIPILISFMFGGFLGQTVYLVMHENAILLPCCFTAGIGVVCLILFPASKSDGVHSPSSSIPPPPGENQQHLVRESPITMLTPPPPPPPPTTTPPQPPPAAAAEAAAAEAAAAEAAAVYVSNWRSVAEDDERRPLLGSRNI